MKKINFLLPVFICMIINVNAQKQSDVDKIIDKYSDIFEWIVKPKYDLNIYSISEQNILSFMNRKYKEGYMTIEGEIIVDPVWGYATAAYDCGIGIVAKNYDRYKYIMDLSKKNTKVKETKFLYIGTFIDGYAEVTEAGTSKSGITDTAGNFVMEFTYGDISLPGNIKDIISGKSNDLIPAKEYKASGMGSWGYVTFEGEWKLDPLYAKTYVKAGDFYPVSKTFFKNDKGLYDSDCKEVIPFEYELLFPLNNIYIQAWKKDEKWGIINKENEVVIPFEYDLFLSDYNNNKIYFEKGNEYGYIHLDNLKVEVNGTLGRDPISFFDGKIIEGRYGIFALPDYKKTKLYGLCKFENDKLNIIIPPKFSEMRLIDPGGKLKVIYYKKFGRDSYCGMLNEKLETVIDPADKEIGHIRYSNSLGYFPIEVKGKCGVASFK